MINDLKNTTKLVKAILERDSASRNSDSILYFRVINQIALKKGDNIRNISMFDFLLNSKEWGYPPFETVRRTRQKIQAEHPELASSERIEKLRAENEQIFREYARSEVG